MNVDLKKYIACVHVGGKDDGDILFSLYERIQNAIGALLAEKNPVTIMVDDISLVEVAARGSADSVMDFLHYCHTLTAEYVSTHPAVDFSGR